MQKMTMIDPVTWREDLYMINSTSLPDFNLLVGKIQMMYSDTDQRLNVAWKSFHHFPLGYYKTNENIQASTNRLWQNWSEAEWDEVQFQPMLHDIVWAGL